MKRPCTEAGLVEALLDGRLAPRDEASLERHIATCGACASDAHEIQRIRAALREPTPAPLPLEHRRARAALLRAAHAPEDERSTKARRTTTWILAAAAFVVAMGGAFAWTGRRMPAPAPQPSAAPPDGAAPPPGSAGAMSLPSASASAPAAAPEPAPVPIAPATEARSSAPIARASTVAPAPSPATPPSSSLQASPRGASPPPSRATSAQEPDALADAMRAFERGDYGGAAERLDAAKAEPDAERAELAEYLRAVALQRADRQDEARAAAAAYLARHPGGRFAADARRIAMRR